MVFHILDSLLTLRHYPIVSYDHRQSKRRLLLLFNIFQLIGDEYPLNQDLKPILDRVLLTYYNYAFGAITSTPTIIFCLNIRSFVRFLLSLFPLSSIRTFLWPKYRLRMSGLDVTLGSSDYSLSPPRTTTRGRSSVY